MTKDYSILLENLQQRHFDETLRMPIVSDAFENNGIPDCIKYAFESMEEIDPSYAYKSFHLAKRIQDKIGLDFQENKISADFRYQGSIQTETNINLYSGVELLVLPHLEPGQVPWKVIEDTAHRILEILNGEDIEEVTFSSKHKIRVTTSKPKSQITILPALWLNNVKFKETKREIDRAICEYNLEQKTRKKYIPFLNIARINSKDQKTKGGLKKAIRLLRSLQKDAKQQINLNSYEISSLLYKIPVPDMTYNPKKGLALLPVISDQLNRIISDKIYREHLISPSEKELIFGKSKSRIQDLQKIKKELDDLISDINSVLIKTKRDVTSEIEYA